MTPNEQRKAAKAFAERWQQAEGNEQRESNKFWIELCGEVLGISNPTHVLDFERKVKGRRIDVFYEDMGVLIENKSRGVSLDEPEQRGKDKHGNPRMVTPYEQARWYADTIVPRSVMPRWIITCNFDEIRIYDLDDEYAEDNYETLLLEELPDQYHRLSFFCAKENSRLEREKDLSVKAGEVVGKLYDAFASAYLDIENDEREQRSLNVLITRIVFLLFAEDADLLQERDAFYKYLKDFQVHHMRQALIDLFGVLKTPKEERDPYLEPNLAAFPYVNGGLFKDDIIVPQFTEDTRFLLLQEASAEFDWKDISPTIFGAVFESTLNPETRRSGGMHYTSIENIHKLTGPLFYDELKDELTAIEGAATEKERKFKLNAFRNKIASLKFLDPACGSGNFLTETYLSLRKLENRVLEDLYGGQMVMGEFDPIQVSIDQFYGIEINEFAVEVAKTALWIAELQMLDQTREILSMWIDPLPLKSNDHIVCANALQTDWGGVLLAEECDYIIGNPPFYGARNQTQQQKDDLQAIWVDGDGNSVGSPGLVDYVSGWFYLASKYMQHNTNCHSALVSTNSIIQGEQVELVWHNLKQLFDIDFDFAYPTFVWANEAIDQAHVHCVIIGFSVGERSLEKTLFYPDGAHVKCPHINGYLLPAPDVYLKRINKSLCGMPQMSNGNRAYDGNNLVMTANEKDELIDHSPDAAQWIRQYFMGADLVKNEPRYVLWLDGVDPTDIAKVPAVSKRVEAVRAMREASKNKSTRKAAQTPHLFQTICQPKEKYLAFPRVSSSRREYLPIAFLEPDVICGDKLIIVPEASLYVFGMLSSKAHKVWTWIFAGRLKSDISYSSSVYNNYPWPECGATLMNDIEVCAQRVLDSRTVHTGDSLAVLYDPDKMPDDLRAAHAALDAAVEAAYGVDFNGDEEKIVAHLFKLYAEATVAGLRQGLLALRR